MAHPDLQKRLAALTKEHFDLSRVCDLNSEQGQSWVRSLASCLKDLPSSDEARNPEQSLAAKRKVQDIFQTLIDHEKTIQSCPDPKVWEQIHHFLQDLNDPHLKEDLNFSSSRIDYQNPRIQRLLNQYFFKALRDKKIQQTLYDYLVQLNQKMKTEQHAEEAHQNLAKNLQNSMQNNMSQLMTHAGYSYEGVIGLRVVEMIELIFDYVWSTVDPQYASTIQLDQKPGVGNGLIPMKM